MEYYETLGLPKKAHIDEVKKAYKKLVLLYHPDKPHGDRLKFEKIYEAYSFLIDENRKAIYDSSLIDEDVISNLFTKLFDSFHKKVEEIKKKKKTNTQKETTRNDKKVKPIKVHLKLTLDEVYRGDIKKVIVRVRRGDTWIKKPFYINLMEHKHKYIYIDEGDEEYGEKGDVEIYVEVLEHDKVKVDNILCEYDLYIEETISLYEYYYGLNMKIQYLNGEVLNIARPPSPPHSLSLNHSFVHVIEEYGLPYIKDDQILHGNLYIHFKIVLPDLQGNNDNIKDLIKTYFNFNGRPS